MAAVVRLGLELGKTLGIDPEKVDYYEKEFDKIPELMEQAIHMTEEKMKGMAERLYSKKDVLFSAAAVHSSHVRNMDPQKSGSDAGLCNAGPAGRIPSL